MNPESKINFDDFKKVEIKVGKIISAEKIPETDKLLKLSVSFGLKRFSEENRSPEPFLSEKVLGEDIQQVVADPNTMKSDMVEREDVRQVVSGIAIAFPDPTLLVGKKYAFITNLEPRKIKGFESQAMILATGEGDTFSLFAPTKDAPEGSMLR